MATEKRIICPLMQRPCIEDGSIVDGELCACKFWVHVVGRHPQTGMDQDLWDCSYSWLPALLIDNTQRQRETGAAVESFRNEMVKANSVGNLALLATAGLLPENMKQTLTDRVLSVEDKSSC